MLDFGFSNYALFEKEEKPLEKIRVKGGTDDYIDSYVEEFYCVVKRSDIKKVEEFYEIPGAVAAPISGDCALGKVYYKIGETCIGESLILPKSEVSKIGYFELLCRIIKNILK